MSHKSKILGWPTPRCVVRWLRHVPSHEAMMFGMPELSGVAYGKIDTGPGRCFWES
ncbi:MAG: hypothetical protein P8Y71_08565 [Pseudolabrys sp.]|jgi:hypothetical protein